MGKRLVTWFLPVFDVVRHSPLYDFTATGLELYDGRQFLPLAVQHGTGPSGRNVGRLSITYLHDGSRCSVAFVHVDLLFSALLHGIALAAQECQLNHREIPITRRTRQIRFRGTAEVHIINQLAGESLRIRAAAAMVPEVLGASRAAPEATWRLVHYTNGQPPHLSPAFHMS